MTLALALCLWVFVIPALAYLAWASLHGFDPSMCSLYGACPEFRR